jgi:hypothetical protein
VHRITEDDVTAINTSMRARSRHADWGRLIECADLRELRCVDPALDLITTPPGIWDAAQMPAQLEKLFEAVIGPRIGISRATKVLHIKRPALIPVCDAYVLRLLGIPGDTAAAGVAAVVHLRKEGRRNLHALRDLQSRLAVELGVSRTLVRVLDALIWGSYPDTWLARRPPPGGPAPG